MSIRHIGIYTPRDAGWIQPGSEQHRQMITPSKVAAILGVSRWESPFSVWQRMRGNLPDEEPSDRFDAGHDAEGYAAARWLRKNPGWRVSRGEVQYVVDPEHFGFPAAVSLDRRATSGRAHCVWEAKTANDLYEWGDPKLDGNLDEGYTTQQIAQMAFTGWTKYPAHLIALGPRWGFERIYETSFDTEVWAWMLSELRRFWASLQQDTPPPLDEHTATYAVLRQLHPDIEPGETVKWSAAQAASFLRKVTAEDDGKKTATGGKSWALDQMKRAQYAVVPVGVEGQPGYQEIRVAERRDNGKGAVAFYPNRKAINEIEALEGALP